MYFGFTKMIDFQLINSFIMFLFMCIFYRYNTECDLICLVLLITQLIIQEFKYY